MEFSRWSSNTTSKPLSWFFFSGNLFISSSVIIILKTWVTGKYVSNVSILVLNCLVVELIQNEKHTYLVRMLILCASTCLVSLCCMNIFLTCPHLSLLQYMDDWLPVMFVRRSLLFHRSSWTWSFRPSHHQQQPPVRCPLKSLNSFPSKSSVYPKACWFLRVSCQRWLLHKLLQRLVAPPVWKPNFHHNHHKLIPSTHSSIPVFCIALLPCFDWRVFIHGVDGCLGCTFPMRWFACAKCLFCTFHMIFWCFKTVCDIPILILKTI